MVAVGTRILNVNDDAATRYLMSRYLRATGFEIVEAASGTEALARARSGGIDAVVLDVKLPDMTGYAVARELRADPATAAIPIVHASATYTSLDRRVAGLESGADAYLQQPVDRDELAAVLRALIRSRRAERDARAAQQTWQATFDALDTAMCLVDDDGRIVRCNRAMATLLGRREEDVLGERFAAAATAFLAPLVSFLDEARGARSAAAREMALGTRCFQASADVMVSSDGEPATVLLLFDVTARKKLEAHRDRLLAEAAAASRAKDEFLATLSHELRTPLNATLGWLQLLEAGELDEATTKKALRTAIRNARQQERLIEDVLDMSRIVSGKQTLDVVPFRWTELVEGTFEGHRPTAATKGVELVLRIDPDMGEGMGDPARLQQAIANVIANAVKFTPRGGKVTVDAYGDGVDVVVSVADSGEGIAPEFLRHVFDRFRQADGTSTRRHGGLGLGLEIVRSLVELHGGTVSAASDGLKRGARFTLRMPRLTTYGGTEEEAGAASRRMAEPGGSPSSDLAGGAAVAVDGAHGACELVREAPPPML